MKTNRFLSLLLTLVLLFGMAPALATTAEATATHKVTFDSRGGTYVPPQTVEDGAYATRPAAIEKNGFNFCDWYMDPTGPLYNYFDFENTPITGDLTLAAVWTKDVSVTVYDRTNEMQWKGGEYQSSIDRYWISSGGAMCIREGEPMEVTLEARPYTGYVFSGWYDDYRSTGSLVSAANPHTFTITKQKTKLYAIFEKEDGIPDVPLKSTVSFDPTEGSGSMESVQVDRDNWFVLPECTFTPPEGKVFNGWDKGNVGASIYITGDTTLKARWVDERIYTVSFSANGGSGAMGNRTVEAGKKFTLPDCAFTPPFGKLFDRWDLGAARETVSITADTVVKALWKDDPSAPVNPFTDVFSGDYYYAPVLWALEKGITTGTSPTAFSPNAKCVRAQVVTFLWRASGCPEPASRANPFKDVKSDAYYYKAVLWAVEKGITTGTSPATFSPNAACTRAQVVTFLWRSEGMPSSGGSNPFVDVPSGKYYTDAVLWAVSRGVTTGTSPTTFSPNAGCTRAQVVTFLYRDIG